MPTKEEIEKLREEAIPLVETGDYSTRSCWSCNSAHEHLKEAELLCCFACGHWYRKGVDITELGEETPLTDEALEAAIVEIFSTRGVVYTLKKKGK